MKNAWVFDVVILRHKEELNFEILDEDEKCWILELRCELKERLMGFLHILNHDL